MVATELDDRCRAICCVLAEEMAEVVFGLVRVDSGFVFGDWAAPPDPLPDGGGGGVPAPAGHWVWVELGDWGPLSDASVRACDWPGRPSCGGMLRLKMCGCNSDDGRRGCGSGSVLVLCCRKLLWDRVFGSNVRNLTRL